MMAASAAVKELPRQEQHQAISRVASGQHATGSTFSNGVSRHKMNSSVSFTNLRAILTSATGQEQRAFVGTIDGGIHVSINFNYEPPTAPPASKSGKKRGRDSNEEAVEAAVQRVKKGLKDSDDCTDDMLDNARGALYAMLTRLRGAQGETAVESWGLSFKKPEGAVTGAATRPRLIISTRITPGVAVPLPSLFQCLGVRCSDDGMLTIQNSEALAPGFDLPLSEQAKAAEAHGQRALTLFATVSK
jgi:hypothetical protein